MSVRETSGEYGVGVDNLSHRNKTMRKLLSPLKDLHSCNITEM